MSNLALFYDHGPEGSVPDTRGHGGSAADPRSVMAGDRVSPAPEGAPEADPRIVPPAAAASRTPRSPHGVETLAGGLSPEPPASAPQTNWAVRAVVGEFLHATWTPPPAPPAAPASRPSSSLVHDAAVAGRCRWVMQHDGHGCVTAVCGEMTVPMERLCADHYIDAVWG